MTFLTEDQALRRAVILARIHHDAGVRRLIHGSRLWRRIMRNGWGWSR